MNFEFEPLTERHARKVAAWRYEAPYDFYDLAKTPEDLEEIVSPRKREDKYAVLAGDDLVGYFSFGEDARVSGGDYPDDDLDLGLGLRPDLTGRGVGLRFVEAGLRFARRIFSPAVFRLSVAAFNERAITVYERAGFVKIESFMHNTNGGEHPFIVMKRAA